MGKKPLIEATGHGWLLWCPGCEAYHLIDKRWTMSGTVECPTFRPSLLSRSPAPPGHAEQVCHLWVRDGRIQYLNDCTHALAGQTIDMEPEPEDLDDAAAEY